MFDTRELALFENLLRQVTRIADQLTKIAVALEKEKAS